MAWNRRVFFIGASYTRPEAGINSAAREAPGDELGDLQLASSHPELELFRAPYRETLTACAGDAAFGYVNAYKNHVNVGFFFGALLGDPARLLEGTGKRGRHVKLRPGQPVDSTDSWSPVTPLQ